MLVLGGVRTRQQRDLQEMRAPVGDVLAADAGDALASNPIPAYARINELYQAQAGYGPDWMVPGDPQWTEPLTAELTQEQAKARLEANGLEGQLEVPSTGIREGALDILISRKKTELGRQSVWNRAPGGLGVGLLRLGAGLAASMADPINIGLGFMPVVSGARYASWLAGKTAVGRFGVRAGVGALEGAAGAAVIEPLILASKLQSQSEYGPLDSFMNVTFGALMGGGLHSLGGAVGDVLRGPGGRGVNAPPGSIERVMALMPLEAKRAVLAQAVGATVEGGAVRADAVLGGLAQQDDRVRRALEQGQISAGYDRTLAEGPHGDPFEVIASIEPTELDRILLTRGTAVERDGEIEVTSNALGRAFGSRRGFGLVKIIWKHGERSNVEPALRVTKDDIVALPDVVRDYDPLPLRPADDPAMREWRVNRDGRDLVYVASPFRKDGKERVVSIYVRERDDGRGLSKEKAGAAPGSSGDAGNFPGDTASGTFGSSSEGPSAAPAIGNVSSRGVDGKVADPDLTFWQGEVKRLRGEAVEPAKSESLYGFIKQHGGVRPDDVEGQEVAALVKGRRRPPPGFFSKGGKNADDLALAAWEAGYLGTPGGARPTLQEFYDVLEREARGERVYPASRADDFAGRKAYRDSVEQALDTVGLSLNDDPAKVAAALADLQRRALAEAQASLPSYDRETDDPAYIEASREADQVAQRMPVTQEVRMQQLAQILSDYDEDVRMMRDGGEMDPESEAAIKAADEVLADAKDRAAAIDQGAACMSRNG